VISLQADVRDESSAYHIKEAFVIQIKHNMKFSIYHAHYTHKQMEPISTKMTFYFILFLCTFPLSYEVSVNKSFYFQFFISVVLIV